MKLRIEKAIYGGSGLARHDGKTIFVPHTLPGETVEAEIQRNKASYAEARLAQILEPSPQRIQPFCPYYEACGGCHYQHATYEEQLRLKESILRESLHRAHVSDISPIEIISASPFGYRNRIRLHIQPSPFTLGYLRGHTHAILPIDECPIAAPALVDAMRVLQSKDADLLSPWAREIELFTDPSSGKILLSVYAPAKARDISRKLHALWQTLQTALPQVAGCAAFTLPAGRGFPSLAAQEGQDHLTYTVDGEPYRVSFGSFFQVNHFLINRMVEEVCGNHTGHLAWDLYAGAGLFARRLSRNFTRTVAVEAAPSSVTDLHANLPAGRIIEKTTLQFLRSITAASSRKGSFPTPDYVVLDPPRAGLGVEVTQLLAQIRLPNITYVSCDPATLSRDLFSLLKSGYHLHKLQLIDMFPQTFHLETVARLSLP